VVLLRKSFPQKTNLQPAAELNVTFGELRNLCILWRRFRKYILIFPSLEISKRPEIYINGGG
jgi:hypothetical protein